MLAVKAQLMSTPDSINVHNHDNSDLLHGEAQTTYGDQMNLARGCQTHDSATYLSHD